MKPSSPIPITLLTGFLGAGKTTLLNYILQGNHGLRVAVLVNDFGAINIDAQLVVGVEGVAGDVVNLANGCICCTIREDLLTTVLDVARRTDPPEYILVEASGVSEPGAIARTFMIPQARPLIQLDGIVTIVDAEQVRQYAPRERMLVLDQIGTADILVLNKIDLVDEAKLAQVRDWIRERVPGTRILEAVNAQVPLELILGAGRYRLELVAASARSLETHPAQYRQTVSDPAAHDDHNHDVDHGLQFKSWSYETGGLFHGLAIKKAFKQLPESIYRAKGILALAELPQQRTIVQLVGRRVRFSPGEPWPSEKARSQLVFIGSCGGFDEAEMARHFDACLVENVTLLERFKLYLENRLTP